MDQRKYFKHRVTDLEDIYAKAGADCALLEELEEELHHRSTDRAKRLLESVQKSLGEASGSTDPIAKDSGPRDETGAAPVPRQPVVVSVDDNRPIDWRMILAGSAEKYPSVDSSLAAAPLSNRPHNIIDTWIALEALSPRPYKRPDDLVIGTGSVVYFENGDEPWLNAERSRPKHNLFYLVYLGAIDLEQATGKLLQKYQDKRVERPSARGLAALGVVLFDKKGIPFRKQD